MNNFYFFIIIVLISCSACLGTKLWLLELSKNCEENYNTKYKFYKNFIIYISILLAISSILYYKNLYYCDLESIKNVFELIWLELPNSCIHFTFKNDFTSTSWIFTISILTAFTTIYSLENTRKSTGKLIAQIAMFSAAMFLLVSGTNLVQIYIGWELTTLLSYLLINFYNEKSDHIKNTAFRIFITNKIGDFFLLFAVALIYAYYGSVDLEKLNFTKTLYTIDIRKIAYFLCMLAISVKSAQLGWMKWLKDAMIAPTPVSALLHSATLVSAGVFLLIRLQETIGIDTNLKNVFLAYSALTVIYASINALYENDIKRILACSTIAEISLMLCSTCLGAYKFTTTFFIIHAFTKTSLFFAAGNLINSLLGETDIRKMGKLMNELPCSYTFILIPCLLLVGIIPFGISIEAEISRQHLYIFNTLYCVSSLFLMLAFARMIYFVFHKDNSQETQINYSIAEKNKIIIATCSNILLINVIIRVFLFVDQSSKIGFSVSWGSIAIKTICMFTFIHLAQKHFFEESLLFKIGNKQTFMRHRIFDFSDTAVQLANTVLNRITHSINNKLFLQIYNVSCFKLSKFVSSVQFSTICYAFSFLFLFIFLIYTMK